MKSIMIVIALLGSSLMYPTFGQVDDNPVTFTWEGAFSGNKAVWKVDDTFNRYSVGGVDVNVLLVDPFDQNTDTGNPSDYNDYTKTNSFYGRGNMVFQITSDAHNQPVCLEFTFSKNVLLHNFDVWDLDYLASASNPFSTYQDSLSFFASNDEGPVKLFLKRISDKSTFKIIQQSVVADYIPGVNGDLSHKDTLGALRVSSLVGLNKFTICYAGGAADEGLSNSQALKIDAFTFCEAKGSISGFVIDNNTSNMLSGSKIRLLDSLDLPVRNENGDIMEMMTSNDGKYYFGNLPFGKYNVVEINPDGYESVKDMDELNDDRISVVLSLFAPDSKDRNFYDKLFSPLAVELLDWEAQRKGSKIEVNWTTQREVSSDYFDILVSHDGIVFNSVGKVPSKNSQVKADYHFSFDQSAGKEIYVALNEYDLDGRVYRKGIKKVISDEKWSAFSLYPNPSQDFITLDFFANPQSEVTYLVTDVKGNILIKNVTSTTHCIIPTDYLPAGHYFIQVNDGSKSETRMFIKL